MKWNKFEDKAPPNGDWIMVFRYGFIIIPAMIEVDGSFRYWGNDAPWDKPDEPTHWARMSNGPRKTKIGDSEGN